MPTENEHLACSCCGGGLRHNVDENAVYGETPYPCDDGVGHCIECFGPSKEKKKDIKWSELTESECRKKMGWAAVAFVEARFPIIEKGLNPANREKWARDPFWKKAALVYALIEKGILAW